jgi:hypothetical protein
MDELGFPREGDTGSFARAFLTMTRERYAPPVGCSRREREYADDLGLPEESDPHDFACAYFAVRDHRRSAGRERQ